MTDRSPVTPEAELFASLQRIDQREKAAQYVSGLLAVEGRKTLRRISDHLGGEAARQSVHHFISGSSWDWEPVRQALARRAERLLRPQAWVVAPTLIPRSGPHSVGVAQRFVPDLGQTVNAQQAYGAWLASDRGSVPVNWQLLLPEEGGDEERHSRAGVPDSYLIRSAEECTGRVLPGRDWRLARRPVVLDAAGLDPAELAARMRLAGLPFVMRVTGQTRLVADRTALPGYGPRQADADRLVQSVREMWRQYPLPGGDLLATSVPVLLPQPGGGPRGRSLLLVSAWRGARREAARYWLTDLRGLPLPALLGLARLSDRVAHDFATVSQRVGVRDFAGRSFQGWHRHITLASVAHLEAVTGAARPAPAWSSAA
ncbi:transposase [Streptomyces sp. NPDC097619]|uniref:IS701 family transposase n=1 Tax=Streptomyces sp. NPDC097619 TaxID=3157228 RepID=UPI0033202C76